MFPGTPPMTGTATLTVYVGDENDNAPDIGAIEPARAVVGTDTRAGDEVFRFQVDDPDLGDDSTSISYICNNAKCREFDFRQISSKSGLIFEWVLVCAYMHVSVCVYVCVYVCIYVHGLFVIILFGHWHQVTVDLLSKSFFMQGVQSAVSCFVCGAIQSNSLWHTFFPSSPINSNHV